MKISDYQKGLLNLIQVEAKEFSLQRIIDYIYNNRSTRPRWMKSKYHFTIPNYRDKDGKEIIYDFMKEARFIDTKEDKTKMFRGSYLEHTTDRYIGMLYLGVNYNTKTYDLLYVDQIDKPKMGRETFCTTKLIMSAKCPADLLNTVKLFYEQPTSFFDELILKNIDLLIIPEELIRKFKLKVIKDL